ncbi:MAG: hypothetical protein ACREXT_13300, partial [Gammaproteobacteria bacterium]
LMNDVFSPSRKLMAAMLVTLAESLSSGCTTVASSSTDTFRDASPHADNRIEAVFMYQSRVASRVLDRYAYLEIDGDADLDPTLVAADSRMADVCRYLNEAAVSRAEGRRPSWRQRLEIFATTDKCAHAAREVELLLENSGDALATAKL